MELKIIRKYFKDNYTIGSLYIDNNYFCDTLEGKISSVVSDNNIAIPEGTYSVSVNYSNFFKRNLPSVLNVPGFSGVKIHANSTIDFVGSINIGENKSIGKLINGSVYESKLIDKISNNTVKLTIC